MSTSKLTVLPVPMRLQSWVPLVSATIVPIATPAWRAGIVLASSTSLTRQRWPALKSLAAEFALQLEAADRQLTDGRTHHIPLRA
ncbi:MAG: hypothetical protein ACOC1F_08305, partial [Myxococcota bacterium]